MVELLLGMSLELVVLVVGLMVLILEMVQRHQLILEEVAVVRHQLRLLLSLAALAVLVS